MLALYLHLRSLLVREEGQDLVEYALLVILIAIVAIIAVTAAGSWVTSIFDQISTTVAPS